MLRVRNVTTEYRTPRGAVRAASDVSFEVPKGGLFTLLGPSGCGKTTILRSIAGLERPVSGEIEAAGRIVFSASRKISVALNRRNFGMVFQSYAIWPHMTVLQNASFPLEVRGQLLGRAVRDSAMQVLETVGLGDFADREATRLSGGQQQRLALARALVMQPDLLLLDEPLSNLDAKLRERMRMELKRIQRELSVTTIYVTHDQTEALALSDEIAVLNDGRVVQIGSPQAIYGRPRDRFVAGFIGSSNFIDGVVLGRESRDGYWRVRSELGDLSAVTDASLAIGAKVAIAVRPENLELSENSGATGGNLIHAKIEAKTFQGDFVDLQLRAGTVILSARTHPAVPAAPGDSVSIRIGAENCVILADGLTS